MRRLTGRVFVLAVALALTAVAPLGAQEQPKTGGVLKVAMIGEPPTLDMHTTTADDRAARSCGTSTRRSSPTTRASTPIPLLAEGHAVDRRRPALHHHAPQGREVPQRQGDDLGRRGGLAHSAGASVATTGKRSGRRRGGRGQGPVHGGDPPEGAVGLAALRARPSPNNGASIYPKEVIDAAGDGPAQGVHRHRPLPLRRAPARPPHQAGALQGLRGAQPSRPTASAASARPTSTRSSSSPCPTWRCGWPAWRPASTTTRSIIKQDQYDRIKAMPRIGAAHRQAARLGDRRARTTSRA